MLGGPRRKKSSCSVRNGNAFYDVGGFQPAAMRLVDTETHVVKIRHAVGKRV
ncbi:MAG: hypothetical protein OEM60_08045 [Gammaproteobacteria bacterium]|nr:hypothetical protein [Gammaproteobacteria bacterium]